MGDPLRVIQVGLGELGRRLVRDLHATGVARVIGAVDGAASLVGRRLSDVVDGVDSDVVVLASLDEVRDWNGVDGAFVTTGSSVAECAPTFRRLLERGLAVVSSCEELAWPQLRSPALASALDDLARVTSGRLLGTGVNPGFLMDALPSFLASACVTVRRVEVHRIQDAWRRRAAFQRKVGVGLTEDEFGIALAGGTFGHVGLGESLHFLAARVGLAMDRWEEEVGPVIAGRDVPCVAGTVPSGHVAGIRQVARGWKDGRPVVELIFQAAAGQERPHDRIVVDGEPALDVVIEGGLHGDVATSAILMHALEALRAAPPGLHDMASVPLLVPRRRPLR